jgi:hypothetical protein
MEPLAKLFDLKVNSLAKVVSEIGAFSSPASPKLRASILRFIMHWVSENPVLFCLYKLQPPFLVGTAKKALEMIRLT